MDASSLGPERTIQREYDAVRTSHSRVRFVFTLKAGTSVCADAAVFAIALPIFGTERSVVRRADIGADKLQAEQPEQQREGDAQAA